MPQEQLVDKIGLEKMLLGFTKNLISNACCLNFTLIQLTCKTKTKNSLSLARRLCKTH